MTRNEKIELIEALKNGMPIKFALLPKPIFLYKNNGDDIYYTDTDIIVTEPEREKYLGNAIICNNVSKSYRVWKFGSVIKLED